MNSMSASKVAIIILNWNQEEETSECLSSLRKLDYKNYEVIVVDNGSADGSAERIKQKFSEIVLIKNRENLGFCGGNNVGIKYALQDRAQYILLLNNDTVVDADMIGKLVEVMEENPEIGAVGPKICFYDRPNVIQSAGGKIDFRTGKAPPITQEDSASSKRIKQVDYISGCALMIRKEIVWEIGLLDERFFNYYEETDYCVRIRKLGYNIVYVSDAKLWHKVGRVMNPLRNLYFDIRNRPLFMIKHARGKELIRFFIYYYPVWVIAYTVWCAVKRRKITEIIIIGLSVIDFILLRFGKGSFDRIMKLSSEF